MLMRLLVILFAIPMYSCIHVLEEDTHAEKPDLHISILQINDIYEITPVAGGRMGGLARVAQVKKMLREQNPNTLMVLAGDYLSPSAIGTVKLDGEPIAGRHMLELLQLAGLDFATFGNHEFDLDEAVFHKRLQETQFGLIATNVLETKTSALWPGTQPYVLRNFQGLSGQEYQLGFVSATIPYPSKYASFQDPVTAVSQTLKTIPTKTDLLLALTHLPLEIDIKLLNAVPDIRLALGGHEHHAVRKDIESSGSWITKADSNAKSVWIHDIVFKAKGIPPLIRSRKLALDEDIPADPVVTKAVDQWMNRVCQAFATQGIQLDEIVGETKVPLNGDEEDIRIGSTNLTDLVGQAFLKEFKTADGVVWNSGMLRYDDVVSPGPLTQYDLIRMFPLPSSLVLVKIKGIQLNAMISYGLTRKGSGSYLQAYPVRPAAQADKWLLNDQLITDEQFYQIVLPEFQYQAHKKYLEVKPKDKNPDHRVEDFTLLERSPRSLRELMQYFLVPTRTSQQRTSRLCLEQASH